MADEVYFIVNNKDEFVLDSQSRPRMYKSLKKLNMYLYLFQNKNYRIVKFKLEEIIKIKESKNE